MLFLTILFLGVQWNTPELLTLWISAQTFDVSSFWTKFNKHNKDEGSRSNFFFFLFFFRSRCLPRCTPARHCCLAEGTCSSAQKQMLFPVDGKAISVLGAPELCISLTSPAKSAPFVYLALMFQECFPALFPTSPSSRAIASSSSSSSPPSSAVITEVLLWATGGSIHPAACCLAELETIPSAAFRPEPVGACQGCCFDVAALFFSSSSPPPQFNYMPVTWDRLIAQLLAKAVFNAAVLWL